MRSTLYILMLRLCVAVATIACGAFSAAIGIGLARGYPIGQHLIFALIAYIAAMLCLIGCERGATHRRNHHRHTAFIRSHTDMRRT